MRTDLHDEQAAKLEADPEQNGVEDVALATTDRAELPAEKQKHCPRGR